MNALLIIFAVITISTQHISKKNYSEKMLGTGAITFATLSAMVTASFFAFQIELPLCFDVAILPYAIIFGLGYGSAVLCSILAISCGSLSLTSLITSYSLIIPTLYGMFFLNEEISLFLIVGLLLLMASLFLINFVKGNKRDKKVTLKWFLYVTAAFFGNGICSAAQKVQQVNFEGKYKAEFMVAALLIVVISLWILALFTEKKKIIPAFKKGMIPIVICGVANGVTNLLVMFLSTRTSASVMYPLVSAGSILLTRFISKLWYKEKLTIRQNIGFALGVASIVFLNL